MACLLGPASDAAAAIQGLVFGVGGDQRLYLVQPKDHWSMLLIGGRTPEKRWGGATDSHGSPDWFWGTTKHHMTQDNELVGDSHLYRVYPMQGTAVQVGEYGIEKDMQELAYNELTLVLYGTDYRSLYTINTTTGAATLVGPLTLSRPESQELVFAMDWDREINQLVAVSTVDTGPIFGLTPESVNTYFVDPTTGNASLVRADAGGGAVTRVTDIWYEGIEGYLYGMANSPVNQIVKVNQQTGLITPIGRIHDNHGITGLGGSNYTVEPIVPIIFHCTSEANAYADVELRGETDSQEAHDLNATPTASAQAMAYVMVEEEPGGMMIEKEAIMIATHQAYTNDLTAYIEAYLDFETCMGMGEGTGAGSGDARFEGILEIGATAEYPAGAGGLTLSAMLSVSEMVTVDEGGWDGEGPEWLLKIWDDDPDNPLVEMDTEGLFFLEVVAGQQLNVSFDYAASAWAGGGWNNLRHDVLCEFATVETLIPEPATLALLGLGGIGLLLRRKT